MLDWALALTPIAITSLFLFAYIDASKTGKQP